MKILVVASYLPFPLHSGGHVRLYNLLKELSKNHKLTLVCEKRSFQTEKDVIEVKRYCEEIITIDRKKQWSIQNVLKTGVSSSPFLVTGHTLSEMKSVLIQKLQEKTFDIIHVETFYVFQNLPKTYIPTVLVEHNIEYSVYEKFVKKASKILQPILALDVIKLKRIEEEYWRQATKLVAVSKDEKMTMSQIRSDVSIVPNGVDISYFNNAWKKVKSKEKTKHILFIGDFKWIQNIKAVEWILDDIWPALQLRAKNGELRTKLWVVGKNIPENFKSRGTPDIIFDENAPDETWKIYQKADLLLAPLVVGGGSSYKILEAMASGVPVITTELGATGIDAKDGKELLVRETPEAFSEALEYLLINKDVYESIRKEGKKFVETNYNWKKIALLLEDVYKKAVKLS